MIKNIGLCMNESKLILWMILLYNIFAIDADYLKNLIESTTFINLLNIQTLM